MQTNYKPTDEVKVIKDVHRTLGLPGSVLSNNTDTNFKPLSVILHNGLGTWQYNYDEVEFLGKEKPEKETLSNSDEIYKSAVESASKKRKYQKRDKSEPAKQKRAYNRKIKS